MTLNEFVAKWNGKYCEVAGSSDALNQCVDICNQYLRDVLGQPIIEWTNAIDFPSKASNKFTYIANSEFNIPSEGDLVIWKPSPGHIAIFIEGNVDTFRSFDENFPTGSPCHIQNHNYTNVLGWLHFTGDNPSEVEQLKQQLANEIKAKNETYQELTEWKDRFTRVCEALGDTIDIDVVLVDIEKLKGMEDIVNERQKELDNKTAEIQSMQIQMQKLTQDKTDIQNKLDNSQKDIVDLGLSINDLSSQINALKSDKPLSGYSKWELFKKLIGF
jgi:hypothetical protein